MAAQERAHSCRSLTIRSSRPLLALAICQRVVNEVGGKLWLEDSALGDARFVVELPAAPEPFEETAVG